MKYILTIISDNFFIYTTHSLTLLEISKKFSLLIGLLKPYYLRVFEFKMSNKSLKIDVNLIVAEQS